MIPTFSLIGRVSTLQWILSNGNQHNTPKSTISESLNFNFNTSITCGCSTTPLSKYKEFGEPSFKKDRIRNYINKHKDSWPWLSTKPSVVLHAPPRPKPHLLNHNLHRNRKPIWSLKQPSVNGNPKHHVWSQSVRNCNKHTTTTPQLVSRSNCKICSIWSNNCTNICSLTET